MLRKIPPDKINGTKNVLVCISRVSTHHNFTFNLRFLYNKKNYQKLIHDVGKTK